MISNLMVQINGRNAVEMNEDFVRHMILNSLRGHNKKFRKQYGQMVIACDSSNVWRKQVFPNYKAGRKANRAKSEHDWEFIFDVLAKIKQEIKDFLPYKVIAVESAEADDIIATLCKRTNEKVDINELVNRILDSESAGYTNISEGLEIGGIELSKMRGNNKFAILVTDGVFNKGGDPRRQLYRFPKLHILGLPSQHDWGRRLASDMARKTSGRFSMVSSHEDVPKALMNLLRHT